MKTRWAIQRTEKDKAEKDIALHFDTEFKIKETTTEALD